MSNGGDEIISKAREKLEISLETASDVKKLA
jgi:hypothetical protein